MDYSELSSIIDVIEEDINRMINNKQSLMEIINQINSKDKRAISNLIKNHKSINDRTLEMLDNIIKKYKLKFVLDFDLFSTVLGSYYVNPSDVNKKKVEVLLNGLTNELNSFYRDLSDKIEIFQKRIDYLLQIKEFLANLLNLDYKTPLSSINVLNELLTYIKNIPPTIISDDAKLIAIHQLTLINLEALQKRERLVGKKNDSNNSDKSYAKVKFEKDNALFFEEVEELVEEYHLLVDRIDETKINQIETLKMQISIDILTDDVLALLEQWIVNIKADFTSGFYIKFIFLQKLSEWYDVYLNFHDEEDYKEAVAEISSLISQYQNYMDSVVKHDIITNQGEDLRDLIYLCDDSFVGIDYINKDSHEYQPADYDDIMSSFTTLKRAPRDSIPTRKVKGAGIPGVSENKFRRFRNCGARVIFIDMINLINDDYKKYLEDLKPIYLIITFGQKHGEHDIYNSVNNKRITDLLKAFQNNINNSLSEICKLTDDFDDRKEMIKQFLEKMINENNTRFDRDMRAQAPKYYQMVNEGELKND